MLKRVLSAVAVFLVLLVIPFPIKAFAQPSLSASAAVLMCAESGEVLCSVNADSCLSMASTTKIMTALITLEQGTPEREITVTQEMVSVEGTSMGLLPGDSVTLKTLVCGMLLASGNDAANTAAIAVAGSVDAFAELMNDRAAEIGMKDTFFVTPSGLDDENHYSTAYDMALLAREAIKNPEFRAICSEQSMRLSYGNPPYMRTLSNHNRLLSSYEYSIGVKTGFTKKSGRCLVSAAYKDGVTLVAVTLNDPNDWYDHTVMLDYGFEQVRATQLNGDLSGINLSTVGGEEQSVRIGFAESPTAVTDCTEITRKIYIKQFIYAPVEENEVVGTALYYAKGRLIHEEPIITTQSIGLQVQEEPATDSGGEDEDNADEPEKLSFIEKIKEWLSDIF